MPRVKAPWARTLELAPAWTSALGEHVIALEWAPGGALLAAARVDGPVAVHDARTGRVVAEVPGHEVGTTALAWHPDGRRLATAGQDGMARVWEAATGAVLAELDGGAAWVEHVAWSPSGAWLATAAGRRLRLFDAAGTLRHERADHASTVSALQWRRGSDEVTTAAYGGIVGTDAASGATVRRYDWKGSVLTIAWSPDGRFLATGDQDCTMHFWLTATGQSLQMWGYPGKVRHLAWDHASRRLATSGAPAVTVWDCRTSPEDTTPLSLEAHAEPVSALAFEHAGDRLASGGEDGRCYVWRVGASARPAASFRGAAAVTGVRWSPDDRLLAVGSAAGTVTVLRAG
jgi:WD40 repeat protein